MKLLITREIPQNAIEQLQKYPQIEIDYRQGPPLSVDELKNAIKGVDAIIPVIPDQITAEILQAAGPNLKLVAHYAVGYDNIDVKAATDLNIYVSNTPGDLTESVAEFSLALMFAISKGIVDSDRYVRGQKTQKYAHWDPMLYLGPTLRKKTLGIIGLGRIGYYLAEIAHKGLDMTILYFDPYINEQADKNLNAKRTELIELLQSSDFISVNCPLNESTHHLIGINEFKQMKPTAYIVNTARGAVINEAALFTALNENWIAGAAIDVFENEPNLYKGMEELSNLIVTPHIASATREARIQMANMAATNVIDVLIHNKAPTNLVNKELEKKTPTII